MLPAQISTNCNYAAFSRKKRFYGLSPRPLIGSIMVQIQNQLQSDIELAQHLCIDWLTAAMGSVCYESQYTTEVMII